MAEDVIHIILLDSHECHLWWRYVYISPYFPFVCVSVFLKTIRWLFNCFICLHEIVRWNYIRFQANSIAEDHFEDLIMHFCWNQIMMLFNSIQPRSSIRRPQQQFWHPRSTGDIRRGMLLSTFALWPLLADNNIPTGHDLSDWIAIVVRLLPSYPAKSKGDR